MVKAHARRDHLIIANSTERKRSQMAKLEVKELLDSGVHFGHLTITWDPNMAPYMSMKHNVIQIINL